MDRSALGPCMPGSLVTAISNVGQVSGLPVATGPRPVGASEARQIFEAAAGLRLPSESLPELMS